MQEVLTSRIDANGATTTLQYDKLNRIGSKHYSSGAPGDIAFCYDGDTAVVHGGSPDWSCDAAPTGTANLVGRLTMVRNPASTTRFSTYDSWGRITSSKQTTQSVNYTFAYSYDASGDLLTEGYPNSGRTITYTYDKIGRTATVIGVIGTTNTNYASIPLPPSSGYAAQGAIQKMTLGGLTEQTCFNARLQPIVIRQLSGTATTPCGTGGSDVLRLSYGYSATNNNGNLATQTIKYAATTFTQSYGYDVVNRLTCANEVASPTGVTCGTGTPNWSQAYSYSSAANRWVSANTGLTLSGFTPVAGSVYDNLNRMNGSSAVYDSAGNQKQIGGYAFLYDAENKMTSSTVNSATATYSYDGQGQRVMKQSGGTTTVYVYDAQGGLAQEYANGAVPAPPCSPTCYLMADNLGSTRLLVDGSGIPKEKHDYLPFGEEIPSGIDGRDMNWGGPDPTQKFTGKEREGSEAANEDYFGARYFSGAQGRFTTVDPVFATASLFDPQSWNGYAYVLNNPHTFVDTDGHLPILAVTALVGAGIGGTVGAVREIVAERETGTGTLSAGRIGTAFAGGALTGGIAGLTLGIGTGADSHLELSWPRQLTLLPRLLEMLHRTVSTMHLDFLLQKSMQTNSRIHWWTPRALVWAGGWPRSSRIN
jgi:RHS repeat-associated protein